jgi:hypothetical protein
MKEAGRVCSVEVAAGCFQLVCYFLVCSLVLLLSFNQSLGLIPSAVGALCHCRSVEE